MPIYDIKCLTCNTISEMIISSKKITDEGLVLEVACPACGKCHLKKMHSYEGSKATIHVTGYSAANGYSK